MSATDDEKPSGLRVTFLGVSTLLFEDGETAILTDGFFSRPSKGTILKKLARLTPDRDLIARCLRDAGVKEGSLKAVVVLHSHFDHALDAPEVVRQHPDARLVGSESTANIGRGYGLPEGRIKVVEDDEAIPFGDFQITMLRSEHSPSSLLTALGIEHVALGGKIEQPLEQPAHLWDYEEGGSYSLFVRHGERNILVQASAGFKRGALAGRQADVVYLGIGTIGKLPEHHREEYWREVVEAVGPKRIIPIHWDDFTRPLDRELEPLPRPLDDFDAAMAFLRERAGQKIDVKLPTAWVREDPFAGL